MRRNEARLLSLCLVLLLTMLVGAAAPARIVLLRPRSSDPALLSAFAHLRGELMVHDFEVIVVDSVGNAPPDELERAAEEQHAVAAISLVRTKDVATADIWISDRVTGKTSRRTVNTAPRPEGPNVLAVRAVELLRASLREFGLSEKPPPDIVGLVPPRAPEQVLAWAAPAQAETHRFVLEAAFVAQLPPKGFDAAYGPSLGFGYDPSRQLALRLMFQGPLRRAHYATTSASATMVQQQLMAEARYRVWMGDTLACSAQLDVGVHHLSIQGKAEEPFHAESDAAWTGLFGVGLGAEWWFVRRAALSLRGRTLVLTPRPVIDVGGDRVPYGRPLFQFTGGIDVSL